ncbi:MAG: major capsid protein, partial [Rhodoferax sp.]|nr:major capsid protein [Rhodoferax sp.]
FTPAYIKDKRVFDANRPFRRSIGEQIGGNLNPQQRLQSALANNLADQIAMLTRRQEVMAVEALRTGAITITGDQYPTVSVSFGRDAALTPATLTSTDAWTHDDSKPLDDLQTWSLRVTEKSGSTANTVVMDVNAWKAFAAKTAVQTLLDRFRGNDQLNPTVTGEGGRYMGNIGDFDIWVYAGWYEHPDTAAVTPYLPANTVLVLGADIEGTRAYGAIRDEAAGFQAMPYFSKSWVDQDPAVRYLLLQSAPLIVPYRINASLCATVA